MLVFEYKSEVLVTTAKWVNDRANEKDIARLDDLINTRTAEDGYLSRILI
jgi:peptide deformylase